MLALAMDNFSIYVVDVELRRIVRKYQGHQNVISDMVGVLCAVILLANLVANSWWQKLKVTA